MKTQNKTYGQKNDDVIYSNYKEFEKEVAKRLTRYINSGYNLSPKLCKRLYKKGYTVSDTCSFLILNSK